MLCISGDGIAACDAARKCHASEFQGLQAGKLRPGPARTFEV